MDIVELLPFAGDLSPAERETARQHCRTRRFKRGEIIHGGGTECLGFVLVLSGLTRTYVLSEEGREVTLFRLGEGECCVLSASCVISQITFESFMAAETDCELLILSSGALGVLADENLHVRCFMLERAVSRFSDVMWAMQNLLFRRFDQRLAAFLLEEAERTGSPCIRMTHEQLAQNTSSAREVVARMLKRFSADGLVELRRGEIRLTDAAGLRALL